MARILVVDDDCDSAALLRIAISLAGHDARDVLSGEEALCLCETFVPDVAFIDLAMDGMDGYELARRLKAIHPTVRAIAVTGVSPTQWREDANVETYLLKPISIQRALELIDASGS